METNLRESAASEEHALLPRIYLWQSVPLGGISGKVLILQRHQRNLPRLAVDQRLKILSVFVAPSLRG